jgi:hypothetical protein
MFETESKMLTANSNNQPSDFVLWTARTTTGEYGVPVLRLRSRSFRKQITDWVKP